MSDYPMLISNKLHSFRNFAEQNSRYLLGKQSLIKKGILQEGQVIKRFII